jgi:hypothetical protein
MQDIGSGWFAKVCEPPWCGQEEPSPGPSQRFFPAGRGEITSFGAVSKGVRQSLVIWTSRKFASELQTLHRRGQINFGDQRTVEPYVDPQTSEIIPGKEIAFLGNRRGVSFETAPNPEISALPDLRKVRKVSESLYGG